MRKEINVETWYRKDHFEFFSKFDEPFYGITAKVDCTETYHTAKKKWPFFFFSLIYTNLWLP
ncbi:CatA-like O-acetyltransferase [Zobellia nedashkovskayae]